MYGMTGATNNYAIDHNSVYSIIQFDHLDWGDSVRWFDRVNHIDRSIKLVTLIMLIGMSTCSLSWMNIIANSDNKFINSSNLTLFGNS